MSLKRRILMRMFGCPQGIAGRLGGMIMGLGNSDYGGEVVDLLQVAPGDRVLEVGFGTGRVIRRLAALTPAGHVAGVDLSPVMVAQARARNAAALRDGRATLLHCSVERLPFGDGAFGKALAINSMQIWPDTIAGLREMRRVLKPGGRIALGFTPYSGQPNIGLAEKLAAAGFKNGRVVESEKGFCALAMKEGISAPPA